MSSITMAWIWSWLLGVPLEPPWSERPKYAARYPFSYYARKWEAEAKSTGNDQYFNDLYDESIRVKEAERDRSLILMSAVRLSLPGSPRAWQWQVDEDAERNCIITLIYDAIYGNVYESGAIRHRVTPGPPLMSGQEMKERYYKEYQGVPIIWTVTPSLDGRHYWKIIHIHGDGTLGDRSSPPPRLCNSVSSDSQSESNPAQTPTSSVRPSSWIGSISLPPSSPRQSWDASSVESSWKLPKARSAYDVPPVIHQAPPIEKTRPQVTPLVIPSKQSQDIAPDKQSSTGSSKPETSGSRPSTSQSSTAPSSRSPVSATSRSSSVPPRQRASQIPLRKDNYSRRPSTSSSTGPPPRSMVQPSDAHWQSLWATSASSRARSPQSAGVGQNFSPRTERAAGTKTIAFVAPRARVDHQQFAYPPSSPSAPTSQRNSVCTASPAQGRYIPSLTSSGASTVRGRSKVPA